MQFVKRTLLASALALGVSGAASAQFSNIYFFGDSLTDVGSFKPVLPAGTGLFTTNPGPVYATRVANQFGFTATPGNQGGNDFAQGGARVTQLPGVPTTPPTGTAAPVSTQIAQLLARGPVDPNALYFVWAGANDIFTQLTLAGAGTITSAQAQSGVTTAASDLVAQVGRLQAAGARNIVVFNLPDIGRTPSGTASGQAGTITALSSLFNSTFFAGLDQTGVRALRLNVFGLLNEVVANPGVYGFTNATAPACGTTASLLCTSANLVTPNAAQTFVFADGVHPTTAGHALIAQYVESTLAAPQQIAALAEAPIAAEAAAFRSLDARMISATNAPAKGKFEAWATYDYANPDLKSGFLSGDGKLDTVSVGADAKLSQRLLVGAVFGYTENRVNFAQSGFKLREATGTLYAGYGEGPWYLGATIGASDLDYRDVHRDITLGAATRTETATTRGYATTARVLGGYWFNLGSNIIHGPSLRYTYQDIKVRAFSEAGSSSTAMSFDQQSRKSGVASLGWQIAGTFGALRPFARASWELETKHDERSVTASVFGTGGSFSSPAYRPDKDYALYTVGASTDLGRVTAFVTGQATGAKNDGNARAVTVGVRVPL
ncbi:MAG: autotransporter domain-containing protein [Pseudomonadota bacterium]|nr:autotransporter domain-containing protein [Pseudomonadota bacterium]